MTINGLPCVILLVVKLSFNLIALVLKIDAKNGFVKIGNPNLSGENCNF